MSDLTYQQALDLLQADPAQFWSSLEGYFGGSVTLTPLAEVTVLEESNGSRLCDASNQSDFNQTVGA